MKSRCVHPGTGFAAFLFLTAVTLLGACTGLESATLATSAASRTPLVLWHSFRGREQDALQFALAGYNQDHERKIAAVALDGDHLTAELERSIHAGSGPDIVIWANDKTGEWARDGIIEPLDGYLTPEIRSRYLPTCLGAMNFGGRQYGLPLSFETLIMYYNRDLVPRPPRTTDEMIRMCRRITRPAQNRYGLVYERGNFYHHAMWLNGFGGSVFDDSGFLSLQSPAAIRSLEFARDLATIHGIIPDTVDWKMQMDLFNSGRAGILLSGPWAYSAIDQNRVNLGIATLPSLSPSGRAPAPFLGVKGFYITSQSRSRAAAFDAISYLTSTFSSSAINAMAGYLPANKLAYDYSIVAADYVTSAFKTQVGHGRRMPASPDMKYVWEVMMTDPRTMRPGCLDRVFLHGVDPRTALGDATAEYQRLHARR